MIEKEELTRHTLHFYKGDYERLQSIYPEFGAALIIRKLVRDHINSIDPKPIDFSKLKVEIKGPLL